MKITYDPGQKNLETAQPPDALSRAEAYGVDTTLLRLALTWTPTQRLEALQSMIDLAAEAAKAQAAKAQAAKSQAAKAQAAKAQAAKAQAAKSRARCDPRRASHDSEPERSS
jgi:hypothetical protein